MIKNIEEILAETQEVFDNIEQGITHEKYNKFANAVSVANYIFFITIIWKSFDLSGNIPFLAKFSLLFFGLGILFSALRSLADYISDSFENLTYYRRLIEIEDQYSEDLKKADDKLFLHLRITNSIFRRVLKDDDGNDILKTIVFFSISCLASLVSFVLLFLGVVFLALSVF